MSMTLSTAVSHVPLALSQALNVGRGGAVIAAASGAVSLVSPVVTSIRGGGAVATATPKSKFIDLTPEGKSVLCMAAGMALHYLGYSFARSITVALFTSASTGYRWPGAFPFAMAFVSPVSLLLLLGYGRVLERCGPRATLKRTTAYCATAILAASAGMEVLSRSEVSFFGIPAMKFITGPLFVFRESYVQLLTSQYWSFMASVLTPNQSAKWFAPIAGLTSIASAVGGMATSQLTAHFGLFGTLACTGFALFSSLVATESAYSIAEANGFNPANQSQKDSKNANKGQKSEDHDKLGMIGITRKIFARVPVLRALFLEILASQGLATVLNCCFVHSLGASIPDDTIRAGWIGNFYALINLISMTLQFGVLPMLMQLIEPKDLWRCIPIFSLACTSFQALQKDPSLYVVSGSLLVMKVLEYSARRMLDEMVYVPLDFESRFVGKEVIGIFGYRFGKSLMSLSLSGLTSAFGNFNLQQLSILSDVAALLWVKTAWDLSALVPTRKEAQDAYIHSHTGSKGKPRK